MKNLLSVLLLFSFLFSCKQATNDTALQNEILRLKQELSALKTTQKPATSDNPKAGLMHAVFFEFKENLSPKEIQEFMDALESLQKIPQTIGLQAGQYIDTGDKRLAKDYDAALLVGFENQQALAIYEKDEFHANIRKQVGKYLAKAPVVYDFKLD